MTAADANPELMDQQKLKSDQLTAERTGLDRVLERIGEKLNPILVKEARQAMKSKQFLITFMLLLGCGWGWSILGIALQAGAVYYAESGQFMLGGYFVVLTVPLMVIVPFAAFRSIAAEKDHGTFELLSITSLNSRQIVTGKLAVAILQIIVYLSALAPFVGFTYLLRGVDLLAIGWVLGYTLLLSLGFSAIGIMIGTLTRSAMWQVVLSVIFLIAIGGATMGWMAFVLDEVLDSSAPMNEMGFWVINAFVATIMVSYIVVAVVAASSMVSFASDNRSTPIRVVLLLQQAIFVGMMCYCWQFFGDDDFFVPFVILPAMSWGIAGALMTGEMGELSTRVKRSLPRSALGRVLLTWFFPGSGTGYVFAVANCAALAITVTLMAFISDWIDLPGAPRGRYHPAGLSLLLVSYVAGYLGVARLIILAIRRRYAMGLFPSLIVHAILVAVGAIAPTVFQLLLHRVFGSEYSPLQATNWAWTVVAYMDNDFWPSRHTWGWPFPPALVIAPVLAFIVFVVNLLFAVKEVEQVRAAAPKRVLDEERAAQGESAKPKSPWDTPDNDDKPKSGQVDANSQPSIGENEKPHETSGQDD